MTVEPHAHPPSEYARLINQLDLTPRAAGKFIGIGDRNGRRWLVDGAPRAVLILLKLMLALKLTPDKVRELIGE